MKKYKILSIAAALTMLCGCSGKNNDSEGSAPPSPVSAAVSSTPSAPAVSSAASVSETSSAAYSSSRGGYSYQIVSSPESIQEIIIGSAFLYGPAGDEISPSDIKTVIARDGSDCLPENLTEDNFSAVLCEGFTYVAQPSKISRNSIDNADVFDADDYIFTDTDGSALKNFVRLNVGDTICGLTLTKGETNFARGSESADYVLKDGSVKKGYELGFPEIYFVYATAEFEGELSMNGYICRVAQDEYGVQAGDILFVPDDGEADFPVMSFRLSGDDGIFHAPQVYYDNGMAWENEFGYLQLGNAASTTADISALPEDGSFVKARITADKLTLSCALSMINSVSAELKDVTVL